MGKIHEANAWSVSGIRLYCCVSLHFLLGALRICLQVGQATNQDPMKPEKHHSVDGVTGLICPMPEHGQ